MIFYQRTTNNITREDLLRALIPSFYQDNNATVLYFEFNGYPEITTINQALGIIDNKREQLTNKYKHGFQCISLKMDPSLSLKDVVKPTMLVANGFDAYFNQTLFIISIVYTVESQICSTIILSDIEKNLDTSSAFYLSSELINEIMYGALEEYHIQAMYSGGLYLFNTESETQPPLPYEGAFHISCKLAQTPSQ